MSRIKLLNASKCHKVTVDLLVRVSVAEHYLLRFSSEMIEVL